MVLQPTGIINVVNTFSAYVGAIDNHIGPIWQIALCNGTGLKGSVMVIVFVGSVFLFVS